MSCLSCLSFLSVKDVTLIYEMGHDVHLILPVVTSSFSGTFPRVSQDWAALLGGRIVVYASHRLCIQRSVRPRKLDQLCRSGERKPCLTHAIAWCNLRLRLDFHPFLPELLSPSLEHPREEDKLSVENCLPVATGRFKLAITDNKGTELCEARSLVNVYFALNECQMQN